MKLVNRIASISVLLLAIVSWGVIPTLEHWRAADECAWVNFVSDGTEEERGEENKNGGEGEWDDEMKKWAERAHWKCAFWPVAIGAFLPKGMHRWEQPDMRGFFEPPEVNA